MIRCVEIDPRDMENLRHYAAQVPGARDRAERARRELEDLEALVAIYERRTGQSAPVADSAPASGTESADHIRSFRYVPARSRSLMQALRELTADYQPRTNAEIEHEIRRLGIETSKASINNRLWDLKQERYLFSPARGVYQRMSSNGSAYGVETTEDESRSIREAVER